MVWFPKKSPYQRRPFVIASIVFLILMVGPGVLVFIYQQTNSSLTSQILNEKQTVSGITAAAIKLRLDHLLGIASAMASSTQLTSLAADGKWDEAAAVTRDLQNSTDFYDSYIDRVVLFDNQGIERAAYPELSSGIGTTHTSSSWYQALTNGSPWFISNVALRSAVPQLNIISIAVPIHAKGQLQGTLTLQIPTSRFLEFGESASLGDYGFIYIVDTKGNIVAHPKYSASAGPINISSWQVVTDALQNKNGIEFTIDPQNNQKSIVSYAEMPTYGWEVVAQESYAEAFAIRDSILGSMAREVVIASIVDLVIAYLVFLFLCQRKSPDDQPIKKTKVLKRPLKENVRGGFTLVELLVVIAILAVLSVIVVLTLNPIGLLQEARDSSRISDLGILKNALALYVTDIPNGNLASSSLGYGSCYLSTASGNGTTTARCGTFTNSYTTNASTSGGTYKKTDSTGWIPVNFLQINFGAPLSALPIDPLNNQNYYYSYAATTTPNPYFEINAFMESKKYGFNGGNDVVSTDGGNNTSTLEVGNQPGLTL